MAGGPHRQAADLTIWGRLNAFNVQKVVWAAEELRLRYRRIDAGRGYGVVDTPEYLAMNPNGRVPVIRDGDFVLWESNVILRYLCARYDPGGLCPADLQTRMEAEQWMDWEAATVHKGFLPVYNVISRGLDFFTPEQAEQAVVETAKRLEVLDARLEQHAFVCGEAFSMGDIPMGVLTDYLVRTGRDLEGLWHVKRWHRALTQRPAMRRAMAWEWNHGD